MGLYLYILFSLGELSSQIATSSVSLKSDLSPQLNDNALFGYFPTPYATVYMTYVYSII